MNNPLLLALFILGIGFFFIFYHVSAAFYRRRHETKYHFYQMFPYEFNYPNIFKDNIYGNLLMILACISVVAFYEINPIRNIYSIVAIILSLVSTAFIVVLLLFAIRYLKAHMIVSSIMMVVSAVLPLFNFFLAFSEYKLAVENINKILCIISMVISALLALSMVLLILNPKLTFRIYMDKELDENGNEILKRPKVIFMALNEWWSFFIFIIGPLAVLLLNIV